MFNFITGLILGAIAGGTLGLIVTGMFVAAKISDQNADKVTKVKNDN